MSKTKYGMLSQALIDAGVKAGIDSLKHIGTFVYPNADNSYKVGAAISEYYAKDNTFGVMFSTYYSCDEEYTRVTLYKR